LAAFEHARPGGLFMQVVRWMLGPLVVLWPAAVLVTYLAAGVIADQTYDRELRDMVRAVGEEARIGFAGGNANPALPALNALRNDPVDRLFVHVVDARGNIIAGDTDLPKPTAADVTPDAAIRFREVALGKELVRIAYGLVPALEGGNPLLIQVGEPIRRRHQLVNDVTWLVMAVIVVLVPVTVALVWFGLRRGLRPLQLLRERVERRGPDDLSAIPPEEVPAEVAPLVNTLNRQLERVRRNLDAQRRFVADAAHQLRTPLAGLKTQAEAALRGQTLEAARARLRQIEESADHLSRLVAQLLSLARADDALAQSAPGEAVDLNMVLHEACTPWAERAVAKGVALGFDPAPQRLEVRGAPLLLRELFANLIDNAIRYTPAGGEVTVRVSGTSPPEVVVEDTGSGIPEVDRDVVFERFYRVLGTGESGSGLGLSIVKTIADLHRASVRVEAPPDGGTRFVVSFP
jgi:two-component system sensor histidine kinase TctE